MVLVVGGCVWLQGGAWLWGDMHGCRGGCGCGGACVVAGGLRGCRGLHGCGEGGMRGCGIRRDTVNERAVRILLECILVKWGFSMYDLFLQSSLNCFQWFF